MLKDHDEPRIKTTAPVFTGDIACGGQEFEHPAFGCITVTRTSGHARLFGSALEESSEFISLSIRRATNIREFHQDRHMPSEELIEVNLSTAQWGELLCSFNRGSGVPCTISHWEGMIVDRIAPSAETLQEEIGREFKERCTGIAAQLDELESTLLAMQNAPSVTKADRKLVEQFTETIEKVKVVAKHEMAAWTQAHGSSITPALPALENLEPKLP